MWYSLRPSRYSSFQWEPVTKSTVKLTLVVNHCQIGKPSLSRSFVNKHIYKRIFTTKKPLWISSGKKKGEKAGPNLLCLHLFTSWTYLHNLGTRLYVCARAPASVSVCMCGCTRMRVFVRLRECSYFVVDYCLAWSSCPTRHYRRRHKRSRRRRRNIAMIHQLFPSATRKW